MVKLLWREPHLFLERRGVVDDGAPLRGYAARAHKRFDVVDGEEDLLQEFCGCEDLYCGRLGRLRGFWCGYCLGGGGGVVDVLRALFSVRTDILQDCFRFYSGNAKQLGDIYLELCALLGWIVGLRLRLVLAASFGSHGRLGIIASSARCVAR